MTSFKKRVEADVQKLMKKGFKVEMIKDNMHEFLVEFHGPINTLYHGHVWMTKVRFSDYPLRPPTIFFVDKIFHPNIANWEAWKGEGRVDLLQDNWNVLNDLVYVYEMVIPQLLAEPNPSRPLNKVAADMVTGARATYDQTVKEYCERYAKKENAGAVPERSASSGENIGYSLSYLPISVHEISHLRLNW